MNYGFVIDNRKCIGCHACSTACKSENEVPLGVNRTWVKYVEKGQFPDTRRFFQVTRCNHCANPPCVHICPVTAMYQRPDGIVEFDSEKCIGCKACIQACPYDAVYIDPETHTAAKCHYCAHRVDVGLEPACVTVCPEHAILAGDLDDPRSEIARVLATENVRVRRPEQGTKPKLFYVEAEESAIVPGLARQDAGSLWSEPPAHGADDWRGPIKIGAGRMAGAMVGTAAAPRETYNVPHRIPWHWQVPAYLVTKGISAGSWLVGMACLLSGVLPQTPLFTVGLGAVALLFLAITTGLLVWDLDRPERFWTILVRPQWRSWLARGAFVLIAFGAVVSAQLLAFLAHSGALAMSTPLLLLGAAAAVLAAIYTAFLFAQAEGRDLWQSTLLPPHMLLQALTAGAATVILMAAAAGVTGPLAELRWVLGGALAVNLFLTLAAEFAIPHASDTAAAAARLITHGHYAGVFRASVGGGQLLPIALILASASPAALVASALLALAGLLAYEWVFVMAPQEIPNN